MPGSRCEYDPGRSRAPELHHPLPVDTTAVGRVAARYVPNQIRYRNKLIFLRKEQFHFLFLHGRNGSPFLASQGLISSPDKFIVNFS